MEATNILNNDFKDRYRIDPLAEITEPPVYCKINNAPSLTAGNFSLINGKKKAGKTFLLGGVVASAVNDSLQIDVIKGCLPIEKNKVLYFDTEQSQYHATRSVQRICRLVGNPNPENLLAYGLRPLSPVERINYIEEKILSTPNVGLVAIDGIRDLLSSGINNEQEATTLTSQFLKWSFNFDLHIVLLLHQNKNDLNPRGHIGTEVCNKAETIISVTKEDKFNSFKVVCEDSRDLPFEEFCFTINAEGLPISTIMPETKRKKVTDPQLVTNEKHIYVLNELYKNGLKYNYAQLTKALSEEFGIGINASKEYLKHYKENGWIESERNGECTIYTLNQGLISSF